MIYFTRKVGEKIIIGNEIIIDIVEIIKIAHQRQVVLKIETSKLVKEYDSFLKHQLINLIVRNKK